MSPRRVNLPVPDPTLHPVGGADADTVGPMQLNLLIHFGLEASHRVLDLGCGIGRLAYKMADYLTTGHYYGLDISKKAIDWLDETYSRVLPTFHFNVMDVWNQRYNPKGTLQPTDVVLPYESSFFNRVCAFSLFTHMQPEDARAYLGEVRRVVKRDGLAVVTFFSIDSQVDTNPQYGDRPFLRIPGREDMWTLDLEVPERGIAFASDLIDRMIQDAGLRTAQMIAGFWRGRRSAYPAAHEGTWLAASHGQQPPEAPYKWAHQDVYALTPSS